MKETTMDISVLYIFLLIVSIVASVKAKPQTEDSRERHNGQRFDRRDFPFDVQDRQPNNNNIKQSRSLDLLRLEALARNPGNQMEGLQRYLRGSPGSLGGFPASQSSSGITGQNANQRIDRSLFNALPGSLNSLLAPQGLVGTAPGLRGANPNLIGGQSGLIGGLPGLVAGTSGLGNTSPLASLGVLPGRSPIADIMAMASFLTKDELNDMFSKDKNFNFIPVILQDSKEEQEVQQFLSFLNKRSEKEKESLETSNNEFEKRGQRSLNTNPILAQQLRGNALQNLAQQNPLQRLTHQNLIQSGINPLLLSQSLQSGTPNPFSSLQGAGINQLLALQSQQNSLQGSGINPLYALQSQPNALQGSGSNPLLDLQSQLQSSQNNGFREPFLSQAQNNQLLSQIQSNQSPSGLGLNPLVQQALLQQSQLLQLQQSQQSQQPQLQALQQLLLRQAREGDSQFLRERERQREISAHLPVEHKQEPFRFPRN